MNGQIRQAVIMAAGRGRRLQPLTDDCPKPLLRVAGRPILEWNIGRLPREIEEVILVVGYRQEMIRANFGSLWMGRRIRYVEQTELKGTGHAVHCCRHQLDHRFLVMNGDDLYAPADLAKLAATDRDSAIMVKWLPAVGRFGAVRLNENGQMIGVTGRTAADQPGLVNTGLYALTHDFFDCPLVKLQASDEYGLPQTLAELAKKHPVRGMEAGFWFPIGIPADLEEAGHLLMADQPI